ncbi:hypothetical protein CMI37_29245 [Candidatus Pacearchaeota archaeon]|nr:hypothetical protein [Candidatus Pacearchaeota archaeon]|tara:strand:- start:4014 stop:4670 length:657 start_codon:yes stop_codon:yes gene_type:complete
MCVVDEMIGRTKEQINELVKEWSNQDWANEYDKGHMVLQKVMTFEELMKRNPYRFKWVKKKAKGVGAALDVGCHNGFLACHLTEVGYKVTGIDISSRAIEEAKKNVPEAEFKLVQMNDPLEFPDESFDCVTALEIIEHVPDLGKFMKEVVRVCKKGGQLFFTTPVGDNYDCDQHLRYFKFYDLEKALSDAGLTDFKICRIAKGNGVDGRKLFGVEATK